MKTFTKIVAAAIIMLCATAAVQAQENTAATPVYTDIIITTNSYSSFSGVAQVEWELRYETEYSVLFPFIAYSHTPFEGVVEASFSGGVADNYCVETRLYITFSTGERRCVVRKPGCARELRYDHIISLDKSDPITPPEVGVD